MSVADDSSPLRDLQADTPRAGRVCRSTAVRVRQRGHLGRLRRLGRLREFRDAGHRPRAVPRQPRWDPGLALVVSRLALVSLPAGTVVPARGCGVRLRHRVHHEPVHRQRRLRARPRLVLGSPQASPVSAWAFCVQSSTIDPRCQSWNASVGPPWFDRAGSAPSSRRTMSWIRLQSRVLFNAGSVLSSLSASTA